ncbi:MAG: MFS transporter [Granulosicoccus sp.]
MAPSLDSRTKVVVAAFLTQSLIIGGMFSYGVFLPVLEAEFGWSRTLLSASSSLAFLIMGLLAYLSGLLNDRYGPRWILSVSGALTGLGYVMMSTMNAPWQLLVYFGILIGIGLSTHDVVTLSTVAGWYQKKRGLMTGIVKTGSASGQILVPLAVTALISLAGWRATLLMLGLFTGLGLLLVAQWMRRANENQSGDVGGSHNSDLSAGLTFTQARKTRMMWTMCAIQFLVFPTLMSIPLHIVAHAKDLGMNTATAATVLSLIGAASILGRLAIGLLYDRIGGKLALVACHLPMIVVLASLLIIQNPLLLYLFALFYGFAHGGLFTAISPTIAELFGMKAHGAIFGSVLFFGSLGGALGPVITGIVFDRTSSYELAFTILMLLVSCSLLLVTTLKSALKDH